MLGGRKETTSVLIFWGAGKQVVILSILSAGFNQGPPSPSSYWQQHPSTSSDKRGIYLPPGFSNPGQDRATAKEQAEGSESRKNGRGGAAREHGGKDGKRTGT